MCTTELYMSLWRNIMTFTSLTIVVLLLIGGCSAGTTVYVDARGKGDEVAKKYPQDRFIVRSGTGDSPEAASEAARLEIIKYFEIKISGETIVKESLQSSTSRGKTVEHITLELSNTIKTSASREIPGIDIVGTEKIRRSDSYEAWAVLDIAKYSGVLRERITEIDNDVDNVMGDSGGSDWKRLRDLTRIMKSLVGRKKSSQDMSLLGAGGVPPSKDGVLRKVVASLDSLVSTAFDVGLVWDGEVESEIKTVVTGGIVDAGIRLREYQDSSAAKDAGADLIMKVRHDISKSTGPKKIGSKEYTITTYDWVLSVDAMDVITDQVIDTLVQRDKFTEMGDAARGQSRMVSKILQNQVPALSTWVYQLIFKPSEN